MFGIDGVYLLRQKAATQRRESFDPTALTNRPFWIFNILGFFNRGIQIRHSVGSNKLNVQRRFWREMERKVRVLMLPPINLSYICFDLPFLLYFAQHQKIQYKQRSGSLRHCNYFLKLQNYPIEIQPAF